MKELQKIFGLYAANIFKIVSNNISKFRVPQGLEQIVEAVVCTRQKLDTF